MKTNTESWENLDAPISKKDKKKAPIVGKETPQTEIVQEADGEVKEYPNNVAQGNAQKTNPTAGNLSANTYMKAEKKVKARDAIKKDAEKKRAVSEVEEATPEEKARLLEALNAEIERMKEVKAKLNKEIIDKVATKNEEPPTQASLDERKKKYEAELMAKAASLGPQTEKKVVDTTVKTVMQGLKNENIIFSTLKNQKEDPGFKLNPFQVIDLAGMFDDSVIERSSEIKFFEKEEKIRMLHEMPPMPSKEDMTKSKFNADIKQKITDLKGSESLTQLEDIIASKTAPSELKEAARNRMQELTGELPDMHPNRNPMV